jgi:hypothetical protein
VSREGTEDIPPGSRLTTARIGVAPPEPGGAPVETCDTPVRFHDARPGTGLTTAGSGKPAVSSEAAAVKTDITTVVAGDIWPTADITPEPGAIIPPTAGIIPVPTGDTTLTSHITPVRVVVMIIATGMSHEPAVVMLESA